MLFDICECLTAERDRTFSHQMICKQLILEREDTNAEEETNTNS